MYGGLGQAGGRKPRATAGAFSSGESLRCGEKSITVKYKSSKKHFSLRYMSSHSDRHLLGRPRQLQKEDGEVGRLPEHCRRQRGSQM